MPGWHRDSASLRFIVLRYAPWLLGLSLAWEIAQLPLYTLWREATPGYMAFAVAHCSAGDLLIGIACLALALMLARAPAIESWRWRRLAAMTAFLGLGHTVFSEWTNTTLGRWTYSDLMPVLNLGGVQLGLSPLAQSVVVAPLALLVAGRQAR